jgi:hypothetical protein
MTNLLNGYLNIKFPQKWVDILRIYYFGYLFFYFQDSQMLMGYTTLSREYWNPTGLFEFLDFLSPPFFLDSSVFIFWKLATFLCLLGFLTNFFKYVTLALTLFYVGYESNFYIFTANYVFLSTFSILVTLLPFGSYYSVEGIWRRNKSVEASGLPIILIQLFYVNCWFGSGVQKLRLSGLDWVTVNQYRFYNQADLIGNSDLISGIMNFIVLFSELTSPLIFHKRLRFYYMLIFLIFHTLATFTFNIPITPWIVGMIFWLMPTDLKILVNLGRWISKYKLCS